MGRVGGRGGDAGRADLFAAHVRVAGGIQGEELEHHPHVAGKVLDQTQRLGVEVAAVRAIVVAEHDYLYGRVGGTDAGRVRDRELLRGAAQIERGGAEGAGHGACRPPGDTDGAGFQAQRGAGRHHAADSQCQRRRSERGSRSSRLAPAAGRRAGLTPAPHQHREQREGNELQRGTVQAQRPDHRRRDYQQRQRHDRGQPAQGGRDVQVDARQAAELTQQRQRQQDADRAVHGHRQRRDRHPGNGREARFADPVAIHVGGNAAAAVLTGHNVLEVVVGQYDRQRETGHDQHQCDPLQGLRGAVGRRY